MAENLQRVNPVLADLLDTKVWEGQKQDRHTKKQRGDQQAHEHSAGAESEGESSQTSSSGRIDVRV